MSRATNLEELSSTAYTYSCKYQYADWIASNIHWLQIRMLQTQVDWYKRSEDMQLSDLCCFYYPWICSEEELSSILLSVGQNDCFRGFYRAFRWHNDKKQNSLNLTYHMQNRLKSYDYMTPLEGSLLSDKIYDYFPGLHTKNNFKSAKMFGMQHLNAAFCENLPWKTYAPIIRTDLLELDEFKTLDGSTDSTPQQAIDCLKNDFSKDGVGFLGGCNYSAYKQDMIWPLGDNRNFHDKQKYGCYLNEWSDVLDWMFGKSNKLSSYYPDVDEDISSVMNFNEMSSVSALLSYDRKVKGAWKNPVGLLGNGIVYTKYGQDGYMSKMNHTDYMLLPDYEKVCDSYYVTTNEGKSVNRQGVLADVSYAYERHIDIADRIVYSYTISNPSISSDYQGYYVDYDWSLRTVTSHSIISDDVLHENDFTISRLNNKRQEFDIGSYVVVPFNLCIDWLSGDDSCITYKPHTTADKIAMTDPMFPKTRENEREAMLCAAYIEYLNEISAIDEEIKDKRAEALSTFTWEEDVVCDYWGRYNEIQAQAAEDIGYNLSSLNPTTLRVCEEYSDLVWDKIIHDPALTTEEQRYEKLREWEDLVSDYENEDESLAKIIEKYDNILDEIEQLQDSKQQAYDEYEAKRDEINKKVFPVDKVIVDITPACEPAGIPWINGDVSYLTIDVTHKVIAPVEWNIDGTFISSYNRNVDDLSVEWSYEWPVPYLVCPSNISSSISGVSYIPHKTYSRSYVGFLSAALSTDMLSTLYTGNTGISVGQGIYRDSDAIHGFFADHLYKHTYGTYNGNLNDFLGNDINYGLLIKNEDGREQQRVNIQVLAVVTPILSSDEIHYEEVTFRGERCCRCNIQIGTLNITNDLLPLGISEYFTVNQEMHPAWPIIPDIWLLRWNKSSYVREYVYEKMFRNIAMQPIRLSSINDLVEADKALENDI